MILALQNCLRHTNYCLVLLFSVVIKKIGGLETIFGVRISALFLHIIKKKHESENKAVWSLC